MLRTGTLKASRSIGRITNREARGDGGGKRAA